MSDFEDRLRTEVTRRTEEFSPSADLPEHIHARVGQRRRQRRRVQAGVLSVAAVAVAGPVLALMLRPSSDSTTTDAVGGEFPPKTVTTQPRTTTSSPEGGTPDTSDVEEPTDTTTETQEEETVEPPPTSPEPTTTDTTETTATTEQPSLKPPDGTQPAAGACAQATEAVVEMVINVDVPNPRCIRVSSAQRLQVRNNTQEQITVSFAHFSATLGPGQSRLFDQPFGQYLEPGGSHKVNSSPYPGGSIYFPA